MLDEMFLLALTSALFIAAGGSVTDASTAESCRRRDCPHPSLAGSMTAVSYNVRRFIGREGESTVEAVGAALAELSPSLVAFNEVDLLHQPKALSSIAARLGNFSVAFFGHTGGVYGNALLSRYPIVATRETHLRGGSVLTIPAGRRKFDGEVAQEDQHHHISRGLLEVDIALPPEASGRPGRLITAAVTHLDHMSEEERDVQLAHIVEALKVGGHPAILLGDLNALTRSDYRDDEWAALERGHASQGWSLPEPARCLARLTQAGYVDAFLASRGGGPLSRLLREEAEPIFTAHVGNPSYRIDYAFVSEAAGLEVSGATVHDGVHLSDHFPVSFDLVPRTVAINM